MLRKLEEYLKNVVGYQCFENLSRCSLCGPRRIHLGKFFVCEIIDHFCCVSFLARKKPVKETTEFADTNIGSF